MHREGFRRSGGSADDDDATAQSAGHAVSLLPFKRFSSAPFWFLNVDFLS